MTATFTLSSFATAEAASEEAATELAAAEEAVEAEYAYKESVEMEHGGKKYYFHVFETDTEGLDKYLMLMDVHGEDTLAHFHAKIGNDIDQMIGREDWYPTFVRPDADEELIAGEIAH